MYTLNNIIQELQFFNVVACFSGDCDNTMERGNNLQNLLDIHIDMLLNTIKTGEITPSVIYDLYNELCEAESYLKTFNNYGILKYHIDKWLFYINDSYPSLSLKNKIDIIKPFGNNSIKPSDNNNIMDLILLDSDEQKQELLKTLHNLIKGEKGKRAAMVFLVCVDKGLLRKKPTYKLVVEEFGNIGNPSGYNNQYSKGLQGFTKEEISGIETQILPFCR